MLLQFDIQMGNWRENLQDNAIIIMRNIAIYNGIKEKKGKNKGWLIFRHGKNRPESSSLDVELHPLWIIKAAIQKSNSFYISYSKSLQSKCQCIITSK